MEDQLARMLQGGGVPSLSELAPHLRFGQLIANLAFLAAGPWNETLWDLEDDRLLAAIEEHLADLSKRQPGAA